MPLPTESSPETDSPSAATHVAIAHDLLKALQAKVGEYPELGAAITKLEMALNDLAIQTGGML